MNYFSEPRPYFSYQSIHYIAVEMETKTKKQILDGDEPEKKEDIGTTSD